MSLSEILTNERFIFFISLFYVILSWKEITEIRFQISILIHYIYKVKKNERSTCFCICERSFCVCESWFQENESWFYGILSWKEFSETKFEILKLRFGQIIFKGLSRYLVDWIYFCEPMRWFCCDIKNRIISMRKLFFALAVVPFLFAFAEGDLAYWWKCYK